MASGVKTGGRTAGTPNKLTLQTRQLLVNVLAEEFVELPNTLAQLTPVERLMQYASWLNTPYQR